MSAPRPAGEIAAFIEHTLFKADATRQEVQQLCREAREQGFHGVCVNGSRVGLAYSVLEETDQKITVLVGFPLGASAADSKQFETEAAVDDGAHEIEVVPNLGRLKDGEHAYVLRELRDVVEAAEERPVKVVLETGLLSDEERNALCQIVVESGAKFATLPVGFIREGGSLDEVKALRELLGDAIAIKAAGNIPDTQSALALIDAGVKRLGTTAGVEIIRGLAP